MGYSPRGCKESDTTERLHFHFHSMGKARDLLKKFGGIKGTFHVRMGMLKDRNNKDLT